MWMAPSSRRRLHLLLLLLLCCRRARFKVAAAATEEEEEALSHYSFPVFDGKSTADGVAVATNSAMLAPATFLFDAQIFPQFNHSEGYVLLSRPVALWRMDDDDAAAVREEASFNTSFTVASASRVSEPVAFVVLLDSFPPLNRKNERHRPGVDADSGVSVPNATSGLAAVEVGTVTSYGPRHRGVGLNVTITPNRTSSAGQLAVRIEYDAPAHRLSVYAGDTPDPLVLDAPLDLASRLPTRAALVGFFADTVRDVVVGVRDWELTVDRLHDNDDEARREEAAKESTSASLLVILVASIGSVAAVAVVVVAAVMVCLVVSRRRALDKELQQCYNAYHAGTRL